MWLAGVAILISLFGCSAPQPGSQSSPAAQNDADPGASQLPVDELSAAIRAHVSSGVVAIPGGLTSTERAELTSLYESGAHTPLWTKATGIPTDSAREALTLIGGATAEGLDPEEYASAALRTSAAALAAARPPSIEDVSGFDVTMSAAMLRYFRHLHTGRVDPRTIGFRLVVPPEPHDFSILLRSALTDQRVTEAAAELAPPLAQYRLLRDMLARYRSLITVATEPLPPLARSVHPGEEYAGLDALYRRLVAFGDLPPETTRPAVASYEEPVVAGVRRFQVRHGLNGDGVIGSATLAAFNVPVAWRVRQIELALERLRWLPDLASQRLIALNIPMFHLWTWDDIPPDGLPSVDMRAIVGKAISTQTPVFVEDLRYVIFRPYWNVPPSILRNEILPILMRDLAYLDREDMEIVRGPGDDARPAEPTPENLELLRQGVLRLRQRPGPHNALGLVKFVFPNDENVYLHGTPAQALFSRVRRDFSHGCVRVEDPVALAEWVLKEQPGWTRERILAAMAAPASQRVDLARPIQVILFYVTAAVMPEDGTIRFAEDVYGHDARLDLALARRQTPR